MLKSVSNNQKKKSAVFWVYIFLYTYFYIYIYGNDKYGFIKLIIEG